jgi:Family of unknown function (DUF6527)
MGQRGVLRTIEGGRLAFWCPGCEELHMVNSGWKFNGNYDKPTFSPSVLVTGGHYNVEGAATKAGHCWCNFKERTGLDSDFICIRCHTFVTDGKIQFLSDCSHKLAGQTVELTLPDHVQD